MNRWLPRLLFKAALLAVSVTSSVFGQSDTLAIEFNDGTVNLYPLAKVLQVSFAGTPTSAQERELANILAQSFALRQNYPNPFNPTTTIEYELPASGEVASDIFDIQGRVVRSLLRGTKNAGIYQTHWDGNSATGKPVASGVYFCTIRFDGHILVSKLLLIR